MMFYILILFEGFDLKNKTVIASLSAGSKRWNFEVLF